MSDGETAEVLQQFSVTEESAGLRLDVFLTGEIEDASRSFIKKLIQDSRVTLNGVACVKPSRTLSEGDEVSVTIPPPPPILPVPEDIPLEILYEDPDLIVINKPAGLVVHPAPGHYTGTLVNALLFHCPEFSATGTDQQRPGIVHRLDKDTSGVMVAAKSQRAYNTLSRQAAAHEFDRYYVALVAGRFKEKRGRIEAGIGRSLKDPGRMAVTSVGARHAITHFEVLEDFQIASYIQLRLDTGRTHQIRVHLRYTGRSVLGDSTYGITDFRSWNIPRQALAALEALQGQALHAERLGFTHPSGEIMTFTAPPPPDFQAALDALRLLGARTGE